MNAATTVAIREDVLRDPRYPVHKIADKLLPYLRVLVEQFQPQQVILFGSYAYGEPDEHSDVDLLVVKEIKQSRLRDAVEIQRAWFPLLLSGLRLDVQLVVETPDRHTRRLASGEPYYGEIASHGLTLCGV